MYEIDFYDFENNLALSAYAYSASKGKYVFTDLDALIEGVNEELQQECSRFVVHTYFEKSKLDVLFEFSDRVVKYHLSGSLTVDATEEKSFINDMKLLANSIGMTNAETIDPDFYRVMFANIVAKVST